MPERMLSIKNARSRAATVVKGVFETAVGKSELRIRDEILERMKLWKELYPTGWYDPPPGGVSVLIGSSRMSFDSMRKEAYWPRSDVIYEENVPVIVYLSPVDRTTQLFGDFGVTIYKGTDKRIAHNVGEARQTILKIAGASEIGMRFSDLHEVASKVLEQCGFQHARIATVTPNAGDSNFGHTVPWADELRGPGDMPFDALRERIRLERKFINPQELYEIGKTCAFTVESRLLNPREPNLPNVFFHVIVTFCEGEKNVLSNFIDV
jgi:hypothetical protein